MGSFDHGINRDLAAVPAAKPVAERVGKHLAYGKAKWNGAVRIQYQRLVGAADDRNSRLQLGEMTTEFLQNNGKIDLPEIFATLQGEVAGGDGANAGDCSAAPPPHPGRLYRVAVG